MGTQIGITLAALKLQTQLWHSQGTGRAWAPGHTPGVRGVGSDLHLPSPCSGPTVTPPPGQDLMGRRPPPPRCLSHRSQGRCQPEAQTI